MAAFCKFVTKPPDVRSPTLGRSQSLFVKSVSSPPVDDVAQSPVEAQSPTEAQPLMLTQSPVEMSSDFSFPSSEKNGISKSPLTDAFILIPPVPPRSTLGSVGRSATQVRKPIRKFTSSIFRRTNTIFKQSSMEDSDLPNSLIEPWSHNKSEHPELEVHGTKSGRGYAGHPFVYADAGVRPDPP